ncbi:hypothetical protein ACLBKS_07030 [Hylemonella sp. W303a]|uniref:capsular polysaccharide export protein, LipB/KpsS family n=1 Tax=Hylemonella sp. W303a TaxID=3389873 RepID=UPI00396B42E6
MQKYSSTMIVFFVNRRGAADDYLRALASGMGADATTMLYVRRHFPSWTDWTAASASFIDNCLKNGIREYKNRWGHPPSALWRVFTSFSTRWQYANDRRVLRRCKPALVVVWNGLKGRSVTLAEAARSLGIPCAFMENGLLPSTTVCDGDGVNALNSMPRSSAFYRQLPPMPVPEPTQLIARPSSISRRASGRNGLPQRYIFIPFQVDSDTQIVLFSPWLADMRALFDTLLELSGQFPQYQFVFKEHPSSKRDYRYLHDLLPPERGFFANEYATQELIEKAEAVITINSTVGIEALLFSKRVIVLGRAFYAIPDLTLAADNAEELKNAISRLQQFAPDEQLRRNFLAYLKNTYLIEGDRRSANEAHCLRVRERLLALAQPRIRATESYEH